MGQIGTGLGLTGLSVAIAGIELSSSIEAKAIWAAIGAIVCALAFAYNAASNEITGTATYRSVAKAEKSELVTRASSPAKFRSATNLLWGASLFCLMVGAGTWKLHQWMEDWSDF